jgi:type II secretory pathway pseudopilin PulG
MDGRKKAGFAILEIIALIVIVIVLLSVGIPALMRSIGKSKASEAPINIRVIANGAIAWYSRKHKSPAGKILDQHFPNQKSPSSIADKAQSFSQPSAAPCATGSPRYKANPSIWTDQPWRTLQFEISTSHYFQYHYLVNNTKSGINPSFTVIANADLDCNRTMSSFILRSQRTTNGEITSTRLLIINEFE